MKADSELIKKYIRLIEEKTGATLIIYDDYRILSGSGEFADLPELRRWHLNDYCIQMKERGMHRWCVGLKEQYNKKVASSEGVCVSTCFCGVTEVAVPVLLDGRMVLTVAAAGFYGPMKEKMKELLGRKTGFSVEELETLRNHSLLHTLDRIGEELDIYLETLSCLLLEYIRNRSACDRDFSEILEPDIKSEYIRKALGYVNEHFMEQIGVKDVAGICNLNSSYLQHIFLEKLGHGIGEEIRMCRIQFAAALLRTSNRPVKNIALSCGYYNVDYFCTVFKRNMGMTPSGYRRKYCRS